MRSLARALDFAMPQKRQRLIEDLHETLGQRLTRLRKERGISQDELAAQLKISQASVSDYERDRLRLHADVIITVAKILQVTTDELLGQQKPSKGPAVRDRRFVRRLPQIDRLPKRDRDALLRIINACLERGNGARAA